MQEIINWLSSDKDYSKGVSLYAQYGKSDFYKNLFASGKTPYNIDKLKDELAKLVEGFKSVPKAVVKPDIVSLPAKTEAPKDYPRYLRIKEEVSGLYAQANRAKFALDKERNPNLLLKIALTLKKLKKAIRERYMLLEHYDLHGAFPTEIHIAKADDFESPSQKIQLLRQSNSKAKKRLQNPACKNKVATAELIARNDKLINELLIKIGRK